MEWTEEQKAINKTNKRKNKSNYESEAVENEEKRQKQKHTKKVQAETEHITEERTVIIKIKLNFKYKL